MKLNYKRTTLVGLAFLSICAFWQAVSYTHLSPNVLVDGVLHPHMTPESARQLAQTLMNE